MESQNHLIDLVDKKYIDDATREEIDALAQAALQEVTGLMEYLQSPEALRNARASEGKTHRVATGASNPEPRTPNREPRTRTRTQNRT